MASPSFAFWFIALTLVAFWGVLASSGLLFLLLATLTGGAGITATVAPVWAVATECQPGQHAPAARAPALAPARLLPAGGRTTRPAT
jgi:hypothetical protein